MKTTTSKTLCFRCFCLSKSAFFFHSLFRSFYFLRFSFLYLFSFSFHLDAYLFMFFSRIYFRKNNFFSLSACGFTLRENSAWKGVHETWFKQEYLTKQTLRKTFKTHLLTENSIISRSTAVTFVQTPNPQFKFLLKIPLPYTISGNPSTHHDKINLLLIYLTFIDIFSYFAVTVVRLLDS